MSVKGRTKSRDSPQRITHKGNQGSGLGQEPDRQARRLLDEEVDVALDALIRVVGRFVGEGYAVMRAPIEPAAVEAACEPSAPADMQRSIDESVEHADDDPDRRKRHEDPDELIPECVGVILLQRVEEVAVPEVQAQL